MAFLPDRLSDAPASAKLVWADLDRGAPLPPSAIATRLRLPDRTVSDSLRLLRDRGLVDTRTSPDDARRTLYIPAVGEEEPEN